MLSRQLVDHELKAFGFRLLALGLGLFIVLFEGINHKLEIGNGIYRVVGYLIQFCTNILHLDF